MSKSFSHYNKLGKPTMVDISKKKITKRIAIASGVVKMHEDTLKSIINKKIVKGSVLDIANVAGIQAGKNTSQIIPLCHPLQLSYIKLDFSTNKNDNSIKIISEASCEGKTGVEMEALTAVCAAALTIYDMCKSMDKNIKISNIRLIHKSGGKSGIFKGEDETYQR